MKKNLIILVLGLNILVSVAALKATRRFNYKRLKKILDRYEAVMSKRGKMSAEQIDDLNEMKRELRTLKIIEKIGIGDM